MVNFAALSAFGTAVLAAQAVVGAPSRKREDSALGQEVAVSAPDGTPISDTAELASQTAREATEGQNQWETTAAYQTTTAAAEYSSSSVAYDTSSAADTSSVAYETSSAAYETSSVAYETSSAAYETSSAAYETSSAVYETTSSAAYETSSVWDTTSTAYTSAATYGSGSSNWGNNGYNDCVQQCIASFGAPPATYTAPSATESQAGYGGSTGSGVTHTVIVAPSAGVFRYVPFAVNASVGDTVKFMWNADKHTVTKSSQLELCNKTDSQPFTSGVQNKSFVFTQVVNTTDPTFFYCGVPTHCQKGMFGIINPPSADVATNGSLALAMPEIVANSSTASAWNTYTQNVTSANPKAASWGNTMDVSGYPSWANEVVAENVMYTRSFLAMNSKVMQDDGSIDMSATDGQWAFPQDLNTVLAAGGDSSASGASGSSGPAATGAAAGGSASPSSSPTASGARGLTASFSLASVVALGAAFLAL